MSGIVEQVADDFRRVQGLDHPRPVIEQGSVHGLAFAQRQQILALDLRQLRGDIGADLDAGERPDPVPSVLRAERLDVREFHIGPGLDLFLQDIVVGGVIDMIENRFAVGVAGAQRAMIKVERAVAVDEPHHIGAESAEIVVEGGMDLVQLGDHPHCVAGPGDHLVDSGPHFIALRLAQPLVDAARNRARAVDALAGGVADHLLAEFAQQHALFGDVGVIGGDADDIAPRRLAVETKQQIRRGEMEEMHGVRLQNLAIMHQPPQLFGGRRQMAVAGDGVHRLDGGEMVADRADAAQPLHRHRNLPIGPALDEGFEAAEFDDMQPDLMDLVFGVEQQSHLAVAFDPGQRVDGDAAEFFRAGGGL